MIDNRTAHLDLPLPDSSNALNEDVLRIIAALQSIDTAVADKATTADVAAAVAALVDASPAALNTLNELAAALNDDPDFAATVASQLALKAPLASPTFTGTVGGITAAMVGAPAGSGNSTGNNTGDQDISGKQDVLVSGTNIKTVNGTSLLGSSDVVVQPYDANTAKTNVAQAWTATQTFDRAVLEKKSAIAATAIDLSLGNWFTKTITSAATFTVSNAAASGLVSSFVLELTNGGSYLVTWFPNVKWANGTAPSLSAVGVDILTFYTHDGGTLWRGILSAKDVR